MNFQEQTEDVQTNVIFCSKVDHPARANQFKAIQRPHLRHWRGDFYDWNGACYIEVDTDTINSEIWKFLTKAKTRNKDDEVVPFFPDKRLVGETLAALQATCHLSSRYTAPRWLKGANKLPPVKNLISFPMESWCSAQMNSCRRHLTCSHSAPADLPTIHMHQSQHSSTLFSIKSSRMTARHYTRIKSNRCKSNSDISLHPTGRCKKFWQSSDHHAQAKERFRD